MATGPDVKAKFRRWLKEFRTPKHEGMKTLDVTRDELMEKFFQEHGHSDTPANRRALKTDLESNRNYKGKIEVLEDVWTRVFVLNCMKRRGGSYWYRFEDKDDRGDCSAYQNMKGYRCYPSEMTEAQIRSMDPKSRPGIFRLGPPELKLLEEYRNKKRRMR